MLPYLKALRPINLVIVALSQIILYKLYFESSALDSVGLVLESPLIYLFSFITVLITAAGYLINDYFDFDSDLVNSKSNRLPHKYHNLIFYYVLVALGFLLALWFAQHIGRPFLSLIYLLATVLLYLYSASWKKKPLIGNVVVALFSSFVMIILVYAEKENLSLIGSPEKQFLLTNTLAFSAFAFLVSLVREIIKDIEDMKGDAKAGYLTFPLKYGVVASQKLNAALVILIVLTLIFWIYTLSSELLLVILGIVLLILPMIYLLTKLINPISFNAKAMSRMCKVVMLNGLIFMLIIGWN